MRTLAASEAVGIRALVVHAKDTVAKAFYEHYDLEPVPGTSFIFACS